MLVNSRIEYLSIFSLLAHDETVPDYLTFEQVLEQALVRITELDQAGSVPELKLFNKGENKVSDRRRGRIGRTNK